MIGKSMFVVSDSWCLRDNASNCIYLINFNASRTFNSLFVVCLLGSRRRRMQCE